MSDEQDKSHVPNYVAPKGRPDGLSANELDKGHIRELYVSPLPTGDEPVRELYVSPLPDPEDEPEPDPALVERERIAREVAEHAALVRRLQDEDRKRAAKSAKPNTEGQD